MLAARAPEAPFGRHVGRGLSFDMTTKSVLPVPHWLHRNRSLRSGTTTSVATASRLSAATTAYAL
jgi:hypothetical protein